MNNYLYYLFLPTVIFFIVFFLNFLLIKKNFLLSQTGDPHQKFANKKNITGESKIFAESEFINERFSKKLYSFFALKIASSKSL